MSPPPFYRDWWLAAALTTSTALPVGVAQAAQITQPVGVVTALPAAAADKPDTLHVGSNITPGQRLQTGSDGPLHVLFLDQSALTLGPNSELTIEEFRYDADSRQGQIRLGLSKGSLRVVGGYISKNNAAVITTPFATVEIQGGISLVSVTPNATQSTFLFGQQMRVSNPGGNSTTVTRPGFSVNSGQDGPSAPTRMSSQQLISLLSQMEQTRTPAGTPSTPSTPSPQLISTSDRPGQMGLPNQQLAPDRVAVNTDNTQQANPTLTLNNLLTTGASTIQS